MLPLTPPAPTRIPTKDCSYKGERPNLLHLKVSHFLGLEGFLPLEVPNHGVGDRVGCVEPWLKNAVSSRRWVLRFRVWGSGFRVWGLGLGV